MQVQELIKKTQNGERLDEAELRYLVEGYTNQTIPAYQMSAWLMAVYFKGLSTEETAILTRLMWKSGESLPRVENAGEYWIDKHSTGGVGDKLSLLLVPVVMSVCERVLPKGRVKMPMISGRGLGHTGGTLDKLESVIGFSPRLELAAALKLLDQNGFFMLGQTTQIAPADRLMYALRDCTATVESIPLIVSSIMSKKLSESLNGLVIDLKWGRGAFMKNYETATELGKELVAVAKAAGLDVAVLPTNMNEPIGWTVGNALEVYECFDFLCGLNQEPGQHALLLALASLMVHFASQGDLSLENAREEVITELGMPNSKQVFVKMFEAQGGDWNRFLADRDKKELFKFDLLSEMDGFVAEMDPLNVGKLVCSLGGGRQNVEADIDPLVGVVFDKKVGAPVKRGDRVMSIVYRDESQKGLIEKSIKSMVSFAANPVAPTVWVGEVLK